MQKERPSLLLSPTEGKLVNLLPAPVVSSLPEQYGSDIMALLLGKRLSIQRKEISDFLASVVDGRLTRESAQICAADYRVLIIEGPIISDLEGHFLIDGRRQHQTLKGMRNIIRSFVLKTGAIIEYTQDIHETVRCILELVDYFGRSEHLSLYHRPSPSWEWQIPSQEELHLWILQGLPDIKVSRGRLLLKSFGSPVNVFNATQEEIAEVRGIGAKLAKGIYEAVR